jgi:hypothetical protein
MSAPFKRHYATARSGNAGASGMRMALDCARNVYEAVDRRMPEAAALANWLRQSAAAFGLPDTAIPDDAPRRSRRRGATHQCCFRRSTRAAKSGRGNRNFRSHFS